MNNKILSRAVMLFLIISMSFLLFSCQEKNFQDYEIDQVVASNRDSRVRKIDEDYFIHLEYSDSCTKIFCIADSEKDDAIAHAMNSSDNILICDGYFEKYGYDDRYLYFTSSTEETLTIVEKESKNVNVIQISEYKDYEKIVWNEV